MTNHHAHRLFIFVALALVQSQTLHSNEALTAGQRNELLRSAVRIRYERREGKDVCVGHGTAFGINLDSYGRRGRRYLLSAAHNVLDRNGRIYSTLKVELEQGAGRAWKPCKVISTDKALDICLLEIGEDLPAAAALAPADEKVLATVIMAGSPRGIPVQLYDGKLVRRFHDGSVQSLAEIQFDHGCSGGPVFSAGGKIIGVAVAGIPKGDDLDLTKGLFVPATAIESFIAPLLGSRREPVETAQSRIRPVPASSVDSEPAELPRPPAAVVAGEVLTERQLQALDDRTVTTNGCYVIHADDNLTSIARRFKVSVQSLVTLNNIKHPDRIAAGEKIRIY